MNQTDPKRDSFERIVLTLKPEPVGDDHLGRSPSYRLKCALKVLLRTFGFRCVRISGGDTTKADGQSKA